MAASQTGVERVVGFDCEFVEPPPEHLIQSECPVCLLVIRDPHQVTCCGNSFCHSCIECIKADNKACPTCNKEGFSDFPDKRLERSLYAFKVCCSHQKDGCEWTGELGQIDAHLNTDPQPEKQLNGCQFAEINCIYDCGDQLQRRYIQTHQIERCTKRPFSCEHCHKYESNFDDVIHNHWPVCGSFPLCCPNECGSFPQRQNVDSHVADECPLTTISCDFLHVGCAVKLPRKDMPEHLRENLLTHISLLAVSHTKQQADSTKQQAQIAGLIAENKELKSENTNLKHNHNSYETNFAALRAEVISLKEENESLKAKIEAFHVMPQHEASARPQQATKVICSVEVVPRTTIPVGPPVVTMTNFQKYKRNGDYWYSRPVYTHHQGYKICLRVAANGRLTGSGTHVSVYVCFMKGEFDDSLKWPFHGVIYFRLLDQNIGQDKTSVITYDDTAGDKVCGRVTVTERSTSGRGPNRFIAHTTLEPNYLRNDTLRFQVYKVELR